MIKKLIVCLVLLFPVVCEAGQPYGTGNKSNGERWPAKDVLVERTMTQINSICNPNEYVYDEIWNEIYYWEPDEFGVYRRDNPTTIICICKKGSRCYILPN